MDGDIKYVNCTDAWFKKRNAAEVVELNEDGESGLYVIDDDGNMLEPYTGQVITHTEIYTDEGGEETTEWTEPVPHKYFLFLGEDAPSRGIEQAKSEKIAEIIAYDVSSNVNGFRYGDVEYWIPRETRVSLMNTANILGSGMMTLWFNDTPLELEVNRVRDMLSVLERYAFTCYNVTEQHKVEVMALDTVEEVDAYDVTVGYPNKVNF